MTSPVGATAPQTNAGLHKRTLIYLDLNKWIDFARAAAGVNEAAKYRTLLDAAEASVAGNRAIFPLSAAHLMEVAKIGNDRRRRDVAKLMVALSHGWFLISPGSRLVQELRNAIALEFGVPLLGGEQRTILTKSVTAALIDPDQLKEVVSINDRILQNPIFLEEFIATARIGSQFVHRWKMIAEDHEKGRSQRWDVSREVRKRVYCVLLTDAIQRHLFPILSEFGLGFADLEKLGQDRCVRLLERVPFLDVELNLHTERNEHRDRKIAANDELDISFLSMAIPYCDVVVTENFWTNVVQRLKLDRKYETKVYGDLQNINCHLR